MGRVSRVGVERLECGGAVGGESGRRRLLGQPVVRVRVRARDRDRVRVGSFSKVAPG